MGLVTAYFIGSLCGSSKSVCILIIVIIAWCFVLLTLKTEFLPEDNKPINFFLFFWPCCAACGILVSRPGIEPRPSAVKPQSPKHWTTREFPTSPSSLRLFTIIQSKCGKKKKIDFQCNNSIDAEVCTCLFLFYLRKGCTECVLLIRPDQVLSMPDEWLFRTN